MRRRKKKEQSKKILQISACFCLFHLLDVNDCNLPHSYCVGENDFLKQNQEFYHYYHNNICHIGCCRNDVNTYVFAFCAICIMNVLYLHIYSSVQLAAVATPLGLR